MVTSHKFLVPLLGLHYREVLEILYFVVTIIFECHPLVLKDIETFIFILTNLNTILNQLQVSCIDFYFFEPTKMPFKVVLESNVGFLFYFILFFFLFIYFFFYQQKYHSKSSASNVKIFICFSQ